MHPRTVNARAQGENAPRSRSLAETPPASWCVRRAVMCVHGGLLSLVLCVMKMRMCVVWFAGAPPHRNPQAVQFYGAFANIERFNSSKFQSPHAHAHSPAQPTSGSSTSKAAGPGAPSAHTGDAAQPHLTYDDVAPGSDPSEVGVPFAYTQQSPAPSSMTTSPATSAANSMPDGTLALFEDARDDPLLDGVASLSGDSLTSESLSDQSLGGHLSYDGGATAASQTLRPPSPYRTRDYFAQYELQTKRTHAVRTPTLEQLRTLNRI